MAGGLFVTGGGRAKDGTKLARSHGTVVMPTILRPSLAAGSLANYITFVNYSSTRTLGFRKRRQERCETAAPSWGTTEGAGSV